MKFIACLFVCMSVAASEIQGLQNETGKPSFNSLITKIEISEQQARPISVEVECDVVLNFLEDGARKSYDLSSTIMGFASGQFRLQVNYGLFSVMDLCKNTQSVILMLKKKAYAGTVAEAKEIRHVSNLAITELAGNKFLFPEIWDEKATSRVLAEENGVPVVFVFKRQEGKEEVIVLKKVYLEITGEDFVIRKVVKYDEQQKLCGIIEYSEYAKKICEIKKGKKEELLPSKIVVQSDSDTKFSFTVNKVKLNKEDLKDAEKKASITIPDNVTPEPLKALDAATPPSE